MVNEDDSSQEDGHKLLQSCQPIEKFLELKNCSSDNEVESTTSMTGLSNDVPRTLGKGIDHQYHVPTRLVERWGSAMGILALLTGYIIFKSPCYKLTNVYSE